MGRLHKTGISQKTCQTRLIFKLSGRKAQDSTMIPSFNFLDNTWYQLRELMILTIYLT